MAYSHPLIIANWKMNTNLADAVIMGNQIKRKLENINHIEVVIAPPSIWLYPLSEIFSKHPLAHLNLAAQNIHFEEEGAYTGETSVKMVKSFVKYVLIGHSERANFGETVKMSNVKIKLALKYKLRPIVFVGDYRRNTPEKELVEDLKIMLRGIEKDDYVKLTIVYEPVWAISSKKSSDAASGHEVEGVANAFRKELGPATRILYGGSVSKQNCIEFLHLDNIDGLIVGKDSLNVDNFIDIVKNATVNYGN